MSAAALDLFSWQPMIGERIRELREKAGLSQTEVAERVGKSQETISRYERTSVIPTEALDEVLSAIGATPEDVQDALRDTPSTTRLRLERRGVVSRRSNTYAYTLADKYRWVQLVQADASLSSRARRVLEALPRCIELDASSPEAAFDLETLAHLSRDVDFDDIKEVWPEVLASPFVERRYEPAKWIVALKFPSPLEDG